MTCRCFCILSRAIVSVDFENSGGLISGGSAHKGDCIERFDKNLQRIAQSVQYLVEVVERSRFDH